ncbi:MAG: M20/M25/M40 family metallo-hydrolase [Gemmatimonadetes bacterium]|nr:M20/M25/M40 family metallo-hydrolase [Gemmatimonadota bacterium]
MPILLLALLAAQTPASHDPRLYDLARGISAAATEATVRKLVGFGTRHTLSDTVSATRGIGAARRWIKSEFDRIAGECGGCLEVRYDRGFLKAGPENRITKDVELVNVIAIQRGQTSPDRYVLITGHYDSRASDPNDATSDAPGAVDDASGTAAVIEAARLLSKQKFAKTIVYGALAGEEQGLLGGQQLARYAKSQGWQIEGVLNNDIVGNSEGIGGQVDNLTFRIFSEPTAATEPEDERRGRRVTGGEIDGPSRQLARYVHAIARQVLPMMRPKLVYRLDRFGRGGDHRAFNDAGFAAVRITEAYENYNRQHQNIRTEGGIAYGDVPERADFPYAARIAGVNVAALAALASAPPPPTAVRLRGGVSASTALSWQAAPGATGYRIYWRDTTDPIWSQSRYIGAVTQFTLDGILIDDHLFGVASVGPDGNESLVTFPTSGGTR